MTLRSGQVAAAAGVTLQTLRYYQRRGLNAEPERTLGGHRLYPPNAVKVLRVIKASQRLGYTLAEVAELLEPASTGPPAQQMTACKSVRRPSGSAGNHRSSLS